MTTPLQERYEQSRGGRGSLYDRYLRESFADVSGGSSTGADRGPVARETFGPVAGTMRVPSTQAPEDTGALGTLAEMGRQALVPGKVIGEAGAQFSRAAGRTMFSKEGLPRAVAGVAKIPIQMAEMVSGGARTVVDAARGDPASVLLDGPDNPGRTANREAFRMFTDPLERQLGVTPVSNRPDAIPYEFAAQLALPSALGGLSRFVVNKATGITMDAAAAGLNRGLTTEPDRATRLVQGLEAADLTNPATVHPAAPRTPVPMNPVQVAPEAMSPAEREVGAAVRGLQDAETVKANGMDVHPEAQTVLQQRYDEAVAALDQPVAGAPRDAAAVPVAATETPFSSRSLGNERGAGKIPIATGLTGAGVGGTAGAAAGSQVGSTPEERRRNAILGGLAGAAGGGALGVKAGQWIEARQAPGAKSPAVSAVASTIASGTSAPTSSSDLLTGAEKIYRDVVNESLPLERLGQRLGGGDKLKNLIAQSRGWQGMAQQYGDDKLAPVLKLARGKEQDVAVLVKAQRALDILDKGGADKTGIPRPVLEQAVKTLQADPTIADAAKRLQGYYRGLLRLRLDEGLITPDAYKAIVASEDYYTPFARDFSDKMGGSGGGKWFNRGTGVAKMDRTAQASSQTRDPFQMAVLHTAETWRQVAKQRVTNMVSELVRADPAAASSFVREVSGPTAVRTGRLVQANVNGVRKSYEVLDKDLYDAWAAFDPPTRSIVVSLLRPFKTILQATVTTLPDFAVANAIRDNTMASVQMKLPLLRAGIGAAGGAAIGAAMNPEDRVKGAVAGGLIGLGGSQLVPNLARTLGTVRKILGNDPLWQQFLRDGGDTFGFYPRTTQDAAKVVAEMQRSGIAASDIISPKRWWEGLQAINSAVEQAPRVQAYSRSLAVGGTAPEAIAASRDISLDFSRIGSRTKGLAATTAFWNAKVQGWDKLGRMLANPKTWAVGAASITAPSVGLWLHNKDNPAYWERPQWERNIFWLVPKGEGQFWRIPKPFELGFVFGSVPERALDYLHQRAVGGDADAAETLQQALKDMLSNAGQGTLPIPTGAEVLIEQLANYDFFRNRPIVKREDVPASVQYDDRTSSVPYLAGQETGVSPQRIEHAVRGLTGSMGGMALDAADMALRKTGMDTRPQTQDLKTPMLSRFVTRGGQITDQEMAVRRRAKAMDEVLNGARKVIREGNEKAIQSYFERYGGQLERVADIRVPEGVRLSASGDELQRSVKELDTMRDRVDLLRKGGAANNATEIQSLEREIAARAQALASGQDPMSNYQIKVQRNVNRFRERN